MKNISLYPGCSLEGTSASFRTSLRAVLDALECPCPELTDWNCCGATSAHAIDHTLYLGLAMRNLALAEKQGFDEVLAPCAACYNRLASANLEFSKDDALLESLNSETDLNYSGNVRVRNVLDFLANSIGLERIAGKVRKPLAGVKVACYYGCLNTRIPRMKSFDDVAYPMSMDRIVKTLGAEPLDWSYKTDCCGASLFMTSEPTSTRLVSRILKDAEARGADCIAVACPLCHNNLDAKQADIRKEHGIPRPLPVLFISQLMGMAFGINGSKLKLNDHFVPTDTLESCTQ